MELQGRVVLITGASSGIGAATAKAIAHCGGQVLLLARTQSALAWIFAKGIVPLIELPVSQPEGILQSPPGSPAASESCRVDTGNLLRTKDFLAIKYYFSGPSGTLSQRSGHHSARNW